MATRPPTPPLPGTAKTGRPVAERAAAARAAALSRAAAKQRMLKQLVCSDKHERALRRLGFVAIAGVDEVGRGALFGPVVAAAVMLPEKTLGLRRMGLTDSKQLTEADRERLDLRVRAVALAVGVAAVDAETIDRVNIYQASRLAMRLAVEAMVSPSAAASAQANVQTPQPTHRAQRPGHPAPQPDHLARPGQSAPRPDHLLIDAMRIDHPCAQTRLIYGDALSLSIAAASVVAKVYRDAMMRALDREYPQYGLAAHKGYATPQHRRALAEHGPCALHRRSFAPVAACDPEAALESALATGDLFLQDEMLQDEMLEEEMLQDEMLGDEMPGGERLCDEGAGLSDATSPTTVGPTWA